MYFDDDKLLFMVFIDDDDDDDETGGGRSNALFKGDSGDEGELKRGRFVRLDLLWSFSFLFFLCRGRLCLESPPEGDIGSVLLSLE